MPILICFILFLGSLTWRAEAAPLKANGSYIEDEGGRIILLRGINVAGHAKVPPFVSFRSASELDPLPGWGFNSLRLLFTWEAYEPKLGAYDESYLAHIRQTIEWAAERNLYVILDFHQDSFSRYLVGGCGEGFPPWAIPPQLRISEPRNDESCENWGVRSAISPGMHKAFEFFHKDIYGVKTRYMKMLERVALALADQPNLIGYDLMNEPWGTGAELQQFYEQAARAVRRAHPKSILFISPQALTSSGLQDVNFDRPSFDNFVYAPHFYDPTIFIAKRYMGRSLERPFAMMRQRAKQWGVPWLLGEFGGTPGTKRIEDYIDRIYRLLDEEYTAGMQWDYTPQWSIELKDGWNNEDFSIADDLGQIRTNYIARPYPQKLAGDEPQLIVNPRARSGELWLQLSFMSDPEKGWTELFVPPGLSYAYRSSDSLSCLAQAPGLVCRSDVAGRQTLELWLN